MCCCSHTEHLETSHAKVPGSPLPSQAPTHLKTVNAEPDIQLYTAQDEKVFQKAIHFLFQLKAKQTTYLQAEL